MLKLKLGPLMDITNGELIGRFSDIEVQGVSTDSRNIDAGNLFIAIPGEKYDGHGFIHRAVNKGARACLVSTCPKDLPHVPIIKVDDTVKALGKIASFYRQMLDIQVIAVTGSTGKTTTKDMIASILKQRFNVAKTHGNYNNEIGLPMTLLSLEEKHDVAVVEMGMRGKGQIAELCEIAMPDVGVVTNVNETHMELLGSIEAIAEAKSELISSIPVSGLGILNRDNKYTWNMRAKCKGSIKSFGFFKEADVRGEDMISKGASGISFNVITPEFSGEAFIGIPGSHNVSNALAAICSSVRYGINMDDITIALRDIKPSGMRMDIFKKGTVTIIDDTYNASPISTQAALETLGYLAGKSRKVAVLGDMFELGGFEKEGHEMVGDKCVDVGVDILIPVGSRACHMTKAALKRGLPPKAVYSFENSSDAARAILDLIQPGDFILVKGSRGMKMEEVVRALREGLESD